MKKSTQYGKGLAGFFFGLILATGIIAGILFFLNQGNQNVFEELTQPKQSEEPEILKPQDKAEKRPATDTSSTQADEEKAKAEKEAAEKEAKAKEAAEKAAKEAEEKAQAEKEAQEKAEQAEREAKEKAEKAAADKAERESKEKAEKAAADKAERETKERADKTAADKAEREAKEKAAKAGAEKEAAKKKLAEKKAAEAKKQNKPTPEQILNSGSIEKARKAANASATKESSNSASKQSAEKAETAVNSGKKAFLQLGSYADRSSADSQRAKLAILGVSSRVVESQNGDKTIYRVQSNTMPQEAAVKLQKNLQGHNINSLIRSTK